MKKLFLVIAVASASFAQAQSVSPQVKLTKGQVLQHISETKATMSQEMMGQTMEFVIDTKGTTEFSVKDASASNYTVASTLKRLEMNMNGMGQEQKIDTDKPDDMAGPMGAGFKDRINKTKEYVIDGKGIITAIKDTAAAEEDKNPMSGMLNSTQQALEKQGARMGIFASIPTKGAKVGDTWVDSVSSGGMKTISTYTLKSVTGGKGTLGLSASSSLDQDIEQGGMAMHMNMKTTTTGELFFETESGLVSNSNLVSKGTGSIEAMGQTIPMTVETTVKSSLSKK